MGTVKFQRNGSREDPKNQGWLKRFLNWISKGAVKSVHATGSCST